MSAQPIGMDVDRVQELIAYVKGQLATLDDAAAAVDDARIASLDPGLWGIVPGGIIVSPLSFASVLFAAGQVRNARNAMDGLLASLGANADQQSYVSSADDASYYLGFMSLAEAQELYAQVLANPDLLLDMGPLRVHVFWEMLTPEQSEELWRTWPMEVANLDGVPFDVRINAHALNAQTYLDNGDFDSKAQEEYLQAVANHEVQLITYDPENHRIIESIGLTAWDEQQNQYVYGRYALDDEGQPVIGSDGYPVIDTTPPGESITFVPGTNTKDEDMYNRTYAAVPEYLLSQDPNAVAFVYKDGVFPPGVGEANSQEYALNAGVTLAQFNENLGFEGYLSSAEHTAIGYSWGFAGVSSSEVAGAHWDTVVSLAGAWVPDGWESDAGTEYYHHSYVDWLSVANDANAVTGTPPDEVIPTDHQYVYQGPHDAEVADGWYTPGDAEEVFIGNHELIATDKAENEAVLLGLRRDILG